MRLLFDLHIDQSYLPSDNTHYMHSLQLVNSQVFNILMVNGIVVNCCSMTKFSVWLTNKMKEEEMSAARLSRLMGKDQGVISRILSGERNASPETLEAIAHALRMPTESVLRAAGILPPPNNDPWVDEMAFKLSQLDPALRETAGRLINALADQEEASQKAKAFKPKKAEK